MPGTEYQRLDLPVRISLEAPGMAVLRTGPAAAGMSLGFDFEWLKRGDIKASDLSWLFKNVPPSSFERSAEKSVPSEKLYRVALDIRSAELAEFDWENLLLDAVRQIKDPEIPAWKPWLIMRRSLVRPRSLTLPLTLPLRILQIDPRPEHPIPLFVRNVFGNWSKETVDQAVLAVDSLTWGPPPDWATVEVLHFDRPSLLLLPTMLSNTVDAETPGTLAWLSRWTERWQTRLVVIHCDTEVEAAAARRLAHSLCDRGGPAVVVVRPENTSTAASGRYYEAFYENLVHDFPIDDILVRSYQPEVTERLFGGAGREDALRVSNVGSDLFDLAQKLKDEPDSRYYVSQEFRELIPAPGAALEVREILERVEKDWPALQFDLHEGGGLLPLSRELEQIREVRKRSVVLRADPILFPPAPTPPPPRFVNSSLCKETNGEWPLITQDSAGLMAGEVYHLSVKIGAKDVRIETIGAGPLIEEVFKWSPEIKGVWVEIGLAGIDFGVIGDPVQELWLPREGDTEPVYFAISSQKIGIAQLRFGLYYKNNLIQSFRLAAKVLAQGEGATAVHQPEELAEALSVPVTRVGSACYMARMEYSRTSDFGEIEGKGERALTLVVNKLGNRDIVTLKGSGVFNTKVFSPDNDMPNIVTQIRTALDEIAFEKTAGVELPQYLFLGAPQDLEARCKKAISKLAVAGWGLFTNLAPSNDLQKMVRGRLEGEGKTIHVAQLHRDKVIPWAFVYDRPYDEQSGSLSGVAVQQGVCLAALPKPPALPQPSAGPQQVPEPPPRYPFQRLECGLHPDCLLNEKRQAERKAQGLPLYDESTVACPLRFWGFRHVLEVPPQQIEEESDEGRSEPAAITPNGPLQLAAGLNASLALHKEHWDDLGRLAVWDTPEYERDAILDLLRTKEPDFIYFYCHARGGQVDVAKTYPPYLEFQAPPAAPGRILPQHFSGGAAWSHAPLVFLNACGTLGYSPDALTPFLKQLVDGRKASGVLGTEVPVAEALAGEFAREFILRFIGGAKAGKAVLEARRALLSRRNPLGLVYTLFAPADLVLKA